jgi:DNA-binding Xre family transcriptional regulator
MVNELHELNQNRLDKDLTYRELSRRVGITVARLHSILNSPSNRVRLRDRTLHKIRLYLESQGGGRAA